MQTFRMFCEDTPLSEGYQDLQKREYVIEATPDVLDAFERFLAHVQWCAGVGHSCFVAMDIDGDGADRFKVVSPNVRDQHPGESGVETRNGKFEVL